MENYENDFNSEEFDFENQETYPLMPTSYEKLVEAFNTSSLNQ